MLMHTSFCTVLSLAVALTAQEPSHRAPPAAPGGAGAVQTAQQQVEGLLAAVRQRDAVALWQWLPTRYQSDVEGLVHDLADRVDEKTYDRAWQLMQRVAKVGLDKQQFVFGNSTVAGLLAQEPERAQAARAAYGALFGLLHEVAGSDLATLEGLRRFDGRAFLANSGPALLGTLFDLARAQGNDPIGALRQTRVTTLPTEGAEARLQLLAPGQEPEVHTFVCMDGRWLPREMARDWSRHVGQLRQQILAMPVGGDKRTMAQAGLLLGTIEGFVRRFEDVDSQADFDQICTDLMALGGRGAATRSR